MISPVNLLRLLLLVLLVIQPTGCKRKQPITEADNPKASLPGSGEAKTVSGESCSWRGQTIKNGEWADDGESNSVNRFCKCEAGKFAQCSEQLPASVNADQVVKIKSTSSNTACTWKGKEIGNGRWVEDSSAKYRYCQCKEGKFVETACSSTLPPNVSTQDVISIASETKAGCSFKGVTVPHDKWAEDLAGTATSRYCKCQDGSFPAATCVSTLPAGVSPSDVIAVGQPPSTGAACSFKGVSVPHGKWAEDSSGNAAYKYCQCQNAAFPPSSCSATLPAGVNSTDVIKIP